MDDKIIKEAVSFLTDSLNRTAEENNKKPFQYVVVYRDERDNLIGYHKDTFCSTTQDITEAKRYSGDNPYKQLGIIRKNLDFILEDIEKLRNTMFGDIHIKVKEKFFANRKPEEVFLSAEYLENEMPPQKFTINVINE